MQVVHGLGGIPLRAAYTLIKNISKKKQKEIDAVRPLFVERASKQGLTKDQAGDLFELIVKSAESSVNKSHSTTYTIMAYQTAYLKTYYPAQFMAALMAAESVDTRKVAEYLQICSHVLRPGTSFRGIKVRPLDINLSEESFTVAYDIDEPQDADHGYIRTGFSSIRDVKSDAIKAILMSRRKDGPFRSLASFRRRVPRTVVTRRGLNLLRACGAFRNLPASRQ